MRSFSPAGMATKAYFGLGAKTFGNPGGALSGNGAFEGGGIIPGPPLARLNQFAFLPELGWVAAGISHENTGVKKSVMRFSSPATGINGLATAADINIPSADANGMTCVYAVNATPPVFVACDGSGHIVTSTDGVTWILAINTAAPGTGIQPRMGVIYDDINNKILCAPVGPNLIEAILLRATPASGVMHFDADVVAAGNHAVLAVGYRAGSGVTLALLERGTVYRSTDGFTWHVTAGAIFGAGVSSRGVFYGGVGNGATHNWLFFGGDSSNLLVQSLDDGTTFSAPVVWTSLVSPAANAPVSLAADFAGNLVMQTNQPGVSPAVSHDFGSTWSFPNLIHINPGCVGTVWDGTKWNSAGATNGVPPPNFFMTSPDGSTWTPGPNQVP